LLYKQRGGGVININIRPMSGNPYLSYIISSEHELTEMLQDIENNNKEKIFSVFDKDNNFIINDGYNDLVSLLNTDQDDIELDLTITYTMGTSLEGFLNKHLDIIFAYDDRKYKDILVIILFTLNLI